MGFRVIFKIDSIDTNERHVGYMKTEEGLVDRSKPLVETSATVRLSAVDVDGEDPDHLNHQVWAARISGNLVLTNVSMEIAQTLQNGHEYTLDVWPAKQAPVSVDPQPSK